jgi:hypothetical protein
VYGDVASLYYEPENSCPQLAMGFINVSHFQHHRVVRTDMLLPQHLPQADDLLLDNLLLDNLPHSIMLLDNLLLHVGHQSSLHHLDPWVPCHHDSIMC